jgi:hypothetical protein
VKKEWREPPNLALLFAALDRHRIRYVLFGTVGLIAYGAATTTGDLDICPAPDTDNLHRLAALLTELKAKPRYVPGFNSQQACEQWQAEPLELDVFDHLFHTMLGDLDIVPRPYGPGGKEDRFTYQRLVQHALLKTAFGISIPVAAFEDLIASKLSARREKDVRILPEIERLQRERAQGKEAGWSLLHSE